MHYTVGDILPDKFQPGDTISKKCVVTRREKMSKSRGNVVNPDEVVRGVYRLDPGYEFRDTCGNFVDYKFFGVWFKTGVGYHTSRKTGNIPVFLHFKGKK